MCMIKLVYRLLIVVIWIPLFSSVGMAQEEKRIVYHPAEKLTIVGKAMQVPQPYHRVDTSIYRDLPQHVVARMMQSAGLAISFKTNSNAIHVKWCTQDSTELAAMTPIVHRGLDLYIKQGGAWQFAGVAKPKYGTSCTDAILVEDMGKEERECLLYLPLYDETTNLAIGIEEDAGIVAGAEPFQKRILVYGSSIVQGSSASRPGMAYPARLSRATGLQFLNLGMGGSAKMEKEVADMIAQIDADAFVLDCVPNSSPKEIRQRTAYLVNTIREKHPNVPIIVVQSVFREQGHFNRRVGSKVQLQNQYILEEMLKLQKKGMKYLYFISSEGFLGDDHEGTTDGVHPNDLGFDRMIEKLKPRLLEILN